MTKFKTISFKIINRIKRALLIFSYKRAIKFFIKDKNEPYAIFLCLSGIGDTVQDLAYINELKKENNVTTYVYASEKLKDVVSSYDGIDNLILYKVNDKTCSLIRNITLFPHIAKKLLEHHIYTFFEFHKFNEGEENKAIYDVLYQNSKEILKLKSNTIIYPKVRDIDVTSIKSFESGQKIALLNPYSNSMAVKDERVFINIAKQLKEKNYIIYTNITPNQKPVDGTIGLTCSLEELYNISKQADLIVSIRSGVLDYIVSSDINMFVIYQCSPSFFERFHMTNWKRKGVIKEFYIDNNIDVLYKTFGAFVNCLEEKQNENQR